MRLYLLFCSFPAVIEAVFCYYDFIQTAGIEPRGNITCEGQCFKDIITSSATYTARYGCDDNSDSYCEGIKNGNWKTQKANGKTRRTYCCGGSLCNVYSSANFKPTVLVVFWTIFRAFM